jgi:hypothetical protein
MKLSRPGYSVLAIATIAFCALLVTNVLPILRGGFGWVWMYDLPRFAWLAPCGIMLVIYCVATARIIRAAPRWLLLWCFVWAALIPLALLTLQGSPIYLLFSRAASPLTGGYLRGATMTDNLGQTLRDLPAFLASYRAETRMVSGIALDPPGLLAAFRAMVSAFERIPALAEPFGALTRPLQCQDPVINTWTNAEYAAAWPQMFMPLWAALTVIPLRHFGRLIFDGATVNKALALWPLVPGMALFVPRLNTLYPLLTLTLLLFLWHGLTRPRLIYMALAGFILSGGTFLNLSLAPLGLLAGLLVLGYTWQRRLPLARALIQLAVFGVAVLSVWAIYYILSGISPLDVIRLGLGTHLVLDRPYLPWLFLHPWDMFMFIGLPVALIALFRGWQATQTNPSARLFVAALALTTVLLILSGTARGETGRVWLFFAPLWLLVAAPVRWEFGRVAPLQALCLICMAAVLRVGFTALEQPAYPPVAGNPEYVYNRQLVDDQDRITLIGTSATQTSDAIHLHLTWRADTPITGRYELSMIVVRPDGTMPPNVNWTPEQRNYPPVCWTPGRPFVDTVIIPTDGIKGGWNFSLQSWNTIKNAPMRIIGAEHIGIGPIIVQ